LEELANYLVTEVLRDSTVILIRAIHPDDKESLLRHFHGLSPESVYRRFFSPKRSLSDDDLRQLTELDFVNHVGLAATTEWDGDERFIGIGRYIRMENPAHAEVAFAVLDDHQGHGIATVLLKHLAKIARMNGVIRFEADVLGSNQPMIEVFGNSGFRASESYEGGVVRVRLDLDGDDQSK